MTRPIKVERSSINVAKRRVDDLAEELGQIKKQLEDAWSDNRTRAGKSQDLDMYDLRYHAALHHVETLQAAVEDYSERLRMIRKLYWNAQENAIARAMQIPK